MKIEQLLEALKNLPCEDCGRTFPTRAIDFDHLPDTGKKLFSISQWRGHRKTFLEVCAELEKCEIVCATCHRIRTDQRSTRNGSRLARPNQPSPASSMPERISAVISSSGPSTAKEVMVHLGHTDDRRIRLYLSSFRLVEGTGTGPTNPARYTLP